MQHFAQRQNRIIHTIMFVILSVLGITYQSQPETITDCYYVNTSLDMIKIYSRIQVNLQRTNKEACKVLQPGLNVSIKMNYVDPNNSSNVIQIEVFDYIYNFSYMTTDKLIINVNQSINQSFGNFYLARAALVTINSITYQTQIIIGLINRVTADNSMFIVSNDSKLFFTEDQICYNTTILTDYINGFSTNDLVNVTAIISYYSFPNGTVGNLTMIKEIQQLTGNNSTNAPPPNPNIYNNSTINYDATTKTFNVCYPVPGYSVYQSMDIGNTQGYLEIYYKATNTTANNSVILYFADTTLQYIFNSMPTLYSQLDMILMRDRIFVQTFVTDQKQQQYYQNILSQSSDYTTNKIIYMYCGTNTSVFGAVYSKSPMLTTDGLTIYNKDYYAPNESVEYTIANFYNYRQQNKTCNLQFEYNIFVTDPNTNKTVVQYTQMGTKPFFTCFDEVKVQQNTKYTSFTLVRNDFLCATFNKSGDEVIFVIMNNITDKVLSYNMISNFGTDNLVHNIRLNYTIDASQMLLYIALKNKEIIDAMSINQLTESYFDVLQVKGIAIIIFSSFQILSISIFIIFKTTFMPMIIKSYTRRKSQLEARKLASRDGL